MQVCESNSFLVCEVEVVVVLRVDILYFGFDRQLPNVIEENNQECISKESSILESVLVLRFDRFGN